MSKSLKASAQAPSNIAFIKYWGKKDHNLNIPTNNSISMNLSNLLTTTTVEFTQKYKKDSFILNNQKTPVKELDKIIKHLDHVRKTAKITSKAKVVSVNNFPHGTGLSSSASGFAALSLAASKSANLNLSVKELSQLARLGSGSACRSIPDGFTEWLSGDKHNNSYAISLFPPDYWEIYDVVVIVSQEKKETTSTQGHKLANLSPFFKTRQIGLGQKIKQAKKYLKQKDFSTLGQLSEDEALNMHAVMISSSPPLLYWTPNTLMLIKIIQKWRREGLETYFTLNTGQDVHILVQKKNLLSLKNKLKEQKLVRNIIINKPAKGARIITKHLF